VLLERDEETAALRAAVDAATAGAGTIVLVQGPPGVGKTRLLTTAAEHGRAAGLRVLTSRGRELEREIALGVAMDLLTPPVTAMPPTQRARLLAGPAAPAGLLFAGVPGDDALLPPPDAMLLALCQLTARLAEPEQEQTGAAAQPVLLILDDLQWADAASLRFLAMLAARTDRLPIAIVAAMRDGDDRTDAPELRALATHPHSRLLTPSPLTTAAVGSLVTAEFPQANPDLAASVTYASGGNPFMVVELLRSLRADGVAPVPSTVAGLVPDTVLRSVLARLGRLPAEAGTLAASLAVLGDGTPLRRAATHAALDLAMAERAADTLAGARLIQPGNPLMFTHPLIGAAVHADLPAFARSRAHRRAADLLIAQGEAEERAAGHLLAVEPEGDSQVVDVLGRAADRAVRRGDPAAAARLLARAVAEPPPPSRHGALLVELGRAQMAAGDMAAHTTLTNALPRLASAEAAQALALLAQVRQGLDDFAGASDAWQTALDLLAPDDPRRQDLLAGFLMTAIFHPPLRPYADQQLIPVLDDARRGRLPSRPSLTAHVTLRSALEGDPPTFVRRLAEHATAADPLLGEVGGNGALMALVVHALVIVGELEAAERIADAALSAAQRLGDVIACGYASYHRALARLGRGALDAALADLEPAQVPYDAGWDVASGWNAWLLARIHLERGDYAAARQTLSGADDRKADSMEAALLRGVGAELDLSEGRFAEALDAASVAGADLWHFYEIDHPGLLPWRTTAALAAHHLGDHDQARQLAAEALERAYAVGVEQAVGSALRLSGLVGPAESRIMLLTQAADTLEPTPAVLETIRALIDLGAALRRAGRHADCQPPLRRALALADRARARPLADRARAELRALGLRPRRAAVTGINALTPAEQRVAELAGRGQSNRQIAQSLFITVKTVETHLARAYRKLTITNRRELADALATLQNP
jgi:DNA-binding CsgD family transcriptional regulator